MGVIGLQTLFREAKTPPQVSLDNLRTDEDGKIHLVIDGNSFLHYVLRRSKGWEHMGHYSSIARDILRIVCILIDQNFAPTFVFDGPLPSWKYEQRFGREKDKVAKCETLVHCLTQGVFPSQDLMIMPPMVFIMASNILADRCEVIFAQGEADLHIAALSKTLGAAVLSSDSDFFIHNVYAYIPLDTLEVSDGSIIGYIWGRDETAAHIGLPLEMLPLFAILCGCDYVDDIESKTPFLKRFDKKSRMHRPRNVVQVLQKYTTPLEAIQDLFTSDIELQNTILRAMDVYNGKSSERNISHKIGEILDSGVFWCQNFVEDIRRRDRVGKEDVPFREMALFVSQAFYRYQDAVNGNLSAKEGLVLYLNAMDCQDWVSLPNIESSMFLLCTIGFLLKSMPAASKVKDYELKALMLMGVLGSMPPNYFSLPSKSPSVSRNSVHLLAQYHTVVTSSALLSQVLFSKDIKSDESHYNLIDPGLFFTFLESLKRGSDCAKLVPMEPYKIFENLYEVVMKGNETHVDFVFENRNAGKGNGFSLPAPVKTDVSNPFSTMSGGKQQYQVKAVPNNYYDESLELTEEDDEEEDEEVDEGEDGELSRETSMQPPRGDTPPSGNMSDSEDEYDHGEAEDDDEQARPLDHWLETDRANQSGMQLAATPRTGANAVNPNRLSGAGGADKIASQPSNQLSSKTATQRTSVRAKDDALETGGRSKIGKGNGLDDDAELRGHLSADEDEASGISGMRYSGKNSGFNNNFKDYVISDELKELFQYVTRYKPQEIDLEPVLKPFIPDFIPAIGDIDAFIKVFLRRQFESDISKIPRPDQKPDTLGLTVLDEPAGKQSDPTVLDLHLRAVSKSVAPVPQVVRSLDSMSLRTNTKPLENWIRNVKELHTAKPPPSVHYSRRMPDIEELMQVWAPEVEQAFDTVALPSPELDMPLNQYARVIAAILDIPAPTHTTQSSPNKDGKKKNSTSTIEALHVIFSLYAEFKNSQHFGSMGRSPITQLPERNFGQSQ
ncbi:Intraflagellar transport protein 46 [Phlyctochytrium planicorne]|nr:Intraflagellar transport protein 46 [Phlyctochytrium planicorne]